MFNVQCSIKTGLYGGSFNPIHIGHIQLSQALLDEHLVDEMWLLVSPQNPFKVNQKLLDDNARLELAQLAVPSLTMSSIYPAPPIWFIPWSIYERSSPKENSF